MAMTRSEQRQASSKRMLDAALCEFAENGYSGSKISSIAKRAGVASGLVSQRFGTKEELYCSVMEDLYSRYTSLMEEDDLIEVLIRLADAIRAGARAQSNDFMLLSNHFSSIDSPNDCDYVIKKKFTDSRFGAAFCKAIEDGNIMEGEPFGVFVYFLRACFFLCRSCIDGNMQLPSSAGLLRIIRLKVGSDTERLALFNASGIPDTEAEAKKYITEKERSLALISNLASDFDCICYVDGCHNIVTKIRLIPQIEELLKDILPQSPSNLCFDHCLKTLLHPDDFPGFIATVSREKITAILETEQAFSTSFRVVVKGEPIHYMIKIVKDVLNLGGYLLGFRNVEKEYQAASREERREEVMKLLSSQYTAMYYVDFVKETFEVFSLSDRIKDDTGEMLKGAVSSSDAFIKFVHASVHPDDRKDMLECLMSVPQRLAHDKSFSFNFHRNYGGEYLYTEMKVVKIDAEDQPVTAVALGFSEMSEELELRNRQELTLRRGIEVLYGTPNAKTALTELMRLLREYHDSDSAYIFEMNRDRTMIRMSYEWVRDELEAVVDQAEYEPIENRAFWMDAFREKGELVIQSVADDIDPHNPVFFRLMEEDVDNFMCVPLVTNGEITGFVGVDNPVYADGNLLILRSIAALVSSEILRRKQTDEEHLLLDKVASNYTSLYFADLNNDHIRNYLITDEYRDRYASASSYDRYMADCAVIDVCEKDRPKFCRMTAKEFVRRQFETRDFYTVNFVDNTPAAPRNFEMQFIKANAEGNQLVLTCRDTSEAVEHEKKQQQAQREQMSTLVAERTMELQEKNLALNRINEDIIELLGNITEARDTDSGRHIRRVKDFTHILASQIMKDWPEYGLDRDSVALMASASALHDVGKIMIPDAILLKPGKLTPEEFTVMKSHCTRGCDILKNAPTDWSADYLKMSTDICHYHHERYNGSGYPEGLVGDQIPISAQIVSVADCFDALTTKRVYKDAIAPEIALKMLYRGECGAFSEKIISSLRNCDAAFLGNAGSMESLYAPVPTASDGRSALKGTKILYAEDNELSRDVCTEILEDEGCVVTPVVNGLEAVEFFRNSAPGTFDAILLDIHMPEMDGIEAASTIRQTSSPVAKTIPIIAVTASESRKDIEACLQAGMNDFLNKPVTVASLTRVLLSCLRDQSDALLEQLTTAVKMANKDPLTGVKNMTAYTDMIATLTESIKKDPANMHFALVECDINNLKQMNDNYGHDVGDIYIKNCCALICGVFKHSPVFRIGGDEFVIILRGGDYENRTALMEELNRQVAAAEGLPDAKHGKVSLAAGIGVFDPDLDDGVSTVFRRADGSMYNRKHLMKLASGAPRR